MERITEEERLPGRGVGRFRFEVWCCTWWFWSSRQASITRRYVLAEVRISLVASSLCLAYQASKIQIHGPYIVHVTTSCTPHHAFQARAPIGQPQAPLPGTKLMLLLNNFHSQSLPPPFQHKLLIPDLRFSSRQHKENIITSDLPANISRLPAALESTIASLPQTGSQSCDALPPPPLPFFLRWHASDSSSRSFDLVGCAPASSQKPASHWGRLPQPSTAQHEDTGFRGEGLALGAYISSE